MDRVLGVYVYRVYDAYTYTHTRARAGYVRLPGWRVNARLSLTLERRASARCERASRDAEADHCSSFFSALRGQCHTLLTRVAGRKARWRVVKRIFYLYGGNTALNASASDPLAE